MILTAHQVLGIIDVIGAFVMIWANQDITAMAGFSTPQARWALCRRTIYLSLAIAMFGLGLKRFVNDTDDMWSAIFQVILLIGIIFFPLARKFGWITQDMLIDGIRTDRYPHARR